MSAVNRATLGATPASGAAGGLARRAAWANLSTVSAAHAVIHATVVLMPLVYPILHADYGYSYTEIGLLVAVPSFIGGALQLIFGYLGRYVARKTLIGVGNMLVGASMFLLGTTSAYPVFMGWSILGRVAGAPQHPVGSALLTDSFARTRRGFALAAHVAGGNLGTLVVPGIGAYLIHQFGWQPTLMLFALPGLVAGGAVLLFVRDPAPVATLGASAEPSETPQLNADGAMRAVMAGERARALFAPLRSRGVLVIILASIVASGGRGVGVLTTYLPLYLADRRAGLGLAPSVVAALFTLLLVGSVIGPLAAGRLSDSLGRRAILLVSYGCAALFSVALIEVAPRAGMWGLVVVIALLGLTAYAESPLLQAYLADLAPEHLKDAAFGWYFSLAFGIGSLWGAVLGAIIDRAGFTATFWTMAGSYVVAAAIILAVPGKPGRARDTAPRA